MKAETQKGVMWVLVVALVVACGLAYYFYHALSLAQGGTNAQAAANQAQQAQVQALVAKVGQLIVLPTNETPTVAAVVDPAQLQSQPFFAGAVKGDVVLIYTGAKKAILYDPVMNKIVEVAPITIGAPSTAPSATPPSTTSK
jgi:hypothetical protein